MSTMNLSFLKDDGDMVLIEAPVDSELDKVLEKEVGLVILVLAPCIHQRAIRISSFIQLLPDV